jgi:hypothetical protein
MIRYSNVYLKHFRQPLFLRVYEYLSTEDINTIFFFKYINLFKSTYLSEMRVIILKACRNNEYPVIYTWATPFFGGLGRSEVQS